MSIIPVICHNYLANSRKRREEESVGPSSENLKKSKYVGRERYYSAFDLDKIVAVNLLRESFDKNNQRGGCKI